MPDVDPRRFPPEGPGVTRRRLSLLDITKGQMTSPEIVGLAKGLGYRVSGLVGLYFAIKRHPQEFRSRVAVALGAVSQDERRDVLCGFCGDAGRPIRPGLWAVDWSQGARFLLEQDLSPPAAD
jgi:hypothetical protein